MSSPQSNLADLRRLVSAACDGVLDQQQQQQLEALLAAEQTLREEYVGMVMNEALLEQWCATSSSLLPDLAEIRRLPEAPSQPTLRTPATGRAGRESTSRRRPTTTRPTDSPAGPWRWNLRWAGALAAAILAVGMAGSFALLRAPRFAAIVAVEDAVWGEGGGFRIGDRVRERWVHVESGEVRLSFDSTAVAAVHGPTRFRVLDANSLELGVGSASVHVPQAAVGFELTSPSMLVRDLGTGFSVVVDPDGASHLQVTEGRVRARAPGTAQQQEVSAGQTLRSQLDAAGRGELGPLATASRRVTTTGQFQFSAVHPPSLGYDAFDNDNRGYVFLESAGRVLPVDLPVNLMQPGRGHDFSATAGVIPRGSRVDCYLIHSSPKKAEHVIRGSVRFPGEILGVITDHDRLNATNGLLGAGWTLQCTYLHRGLESEPAPNWDSVAISADRRTLSLTLSTQAIDHIRVLVRSEP
ncbi:MAG TPA: hypothetical protein PJ982_05880 [Lacipirellulaceae bacterium]|nr:hypothetical protein [Lacipirellulaceae bacterium]